ncbi:uncharacterized protein BP01DRAFT_179735 [Aspergillus saccharolyticus JOP 1030-1]|uniref:Uncharacterized protein n=1 Tax=Aspergillus saccharolyticus JOP 1030-1 TaxID=1450539 RepID=A0A318ZV74_9EURO|nr:hypothetical protein BP01DRAFT_179735 [Aspergillus saccharolyticus JOP 1030-1]PYH48273.1 hypothetical protein BP01DRAFT_179735 [Aspergillus saccharolyticus JOP 1030-1]
MKTIESMKNQELERNEEGKVKHVFLKRMQQRGSRINLRVGTHSASSLDNLPIPPPPQKEIKGNEDRLVRDAQP